MLIQAMAHLVRCQFIARNVTIQLGQRSCQHLADGFFEEFGVDGFEDGTLRNFLPDRLYLLTRNSR